MNLTVSMSFANYDFCGYALILALALFNKGSIQRIISLYMLSKSNRPTISKLYLDRLGSQEKF